MDLNKLTLEKIIDSVPLESLLRWETVSPILQLSSEDTPATAKHQDNILDIVAPTHLVQTKEQEKLVKAISLRSASRHATLLNKVTRLEMEKKELLEPLKEDYGDHKEPIKILLVEDLHLQRVLLQKLLHQPNQLQLEFEVVWTETLADSLEKLKAESFYGILLDLNLPDSRGLDTFFTLKKQVPHLPILILTGAYNRELEMALECLQQGAQDYLLKQDILQYPEVYQEMLVRSLRYAIERQKIEATIQQQTVELIASNQQLEQEIQQRKLIEQELEKRVRERTAALELANASLKKEIEVRYAVEIAMRESEERYRRIVETAEEGIWVIDAQSNTSFVNPKMAQMLGYTVAEMKGKSMFEFMDSEGKAIAQRNIERRRQGIEEQYDFKFLRRDGSELWTMISTKPILTPTGEYAGALKMVADISQRKQAEKALQETNQLLQVISLAESQFIADVQPQLLFDNLLENLLQLTNSEYGFIGEIRHNEKNQPSGAEGYLKMRGQPDLKTHAITDIAWNEETRKFYQEWATQGMEFDDLKTIFGAVIVTGEPVIANNPLTDPRPGGKPPGHPPLNAFLGLPFYSNKQFIGMVGIANGPSGYDEQLVEYLQPFLSTCANIIQAYRSEQGRQEAEAELRHKTEELLLITNNLPAWIAYIDKEERYRFSNQKHQELLGLPAAEIVGKSVLSVRGSVNYESLKSHLDRALAGEKVNLERKIKATDGKEYDTLFRMVPDLEEGEVRGCFIIALDIGDRLKAERSLKQLNQELETRVEERTALLQESQEQLQDLFDNANDLIHIISLEDTSFLYVNRAWREVLGYQEEEISQLCVFDTIHPDHRQQCLELFSQFKSGKIDRRERMELLFLTKEGQPIVLEGSISCRWQEGKPISTRAILRDVTKQKQAEQELQKSEQRFRAIFERAAVGIVQINLSGKFVTVNPQFCTIMGYSEEELLQKTLMELTYPEDLEKDLQLIKQLANGEIDTFSREKRYFHKNGNLVWGHLTFSSVRTDRGKVDYLIAVLEDISERKRAEDKLNSILNSMEDLVWSVNADNGDVIYINPGIERVYKRTTAEFSSNQNLWLEVIHPEDRSWVKEHILGMFNVNGSRDLEYRIVRPSGEIRWLRDRANIIYDSAGKAIRIDGIATDITSNKQAEEKLRKAYEQEKELKELKTEFIDIASHEFRTPLTTIIGSAEFLANYYERLTPEKRNKHVSNIQVAGHRIDNLIDDILALSKAESGKIELNLQLLDLEIFCRNLIESLLVGVSQEHQLNFVNLGLSSESIYLDRKLLERILNNLLSNAFKYSPAGSQVDFTIQEQERQVIFEVTDRGIGIPPEDRVHLFTSFHRGKNVGNIPGTGLGLNIVKKYVELQDGQISFTSKIGVGTTFRLIIPGQQL